LIGQNSLEGAEILELRNLGTFLNPLLDREGERILRGRIEIFHYFQGVVAGLAEV
jgi:hypothetical protein